MADLISQRDQGRQALFDTIDLFCKEVDMMPLEEREQSLQVLWLRIKKKKRNPVMPFMCFFGQNYYNLGFFLYVLFIAQCSFGLPVWLYVQCLFVKLITSCFVSFF